MLSDPRVNVLAVGRANEAGLPCWSGPEAQPVWHRRRMRHGSSAEQRDDESATFRVLARSNDIVIQVVDRHRGSA